MTNFIPGVLASITATVIYVVIVKCVLPTIRCKWLYTGIKINGLWDITEMRNGKRIKVGQIKFKQNGRKITGSSVRSKTRDGNKSNRKFQYNGSIFGHQVTLTFDDKKGIGFDTGSYVFLVQNDCKTMIGMATFNGKKENKIVSEPRTLRKQVS